MILYLSNLKKKSNSELRHMSVGVEGATVFQTLILCPVWKLFCTCQISKIQSFVTSEMDEVGDALNFDILAFLKMILYLSIYKNSELCHMRVEKIFRRGMPQHSELRFCIPKLHRVYAKIL